MQFFRCLDSHLKIDKKQKEIKKVKKGRRGAKFHVSRYVHAKFRSSTVLNKFCTQRRMSKIFLRF